MIREGNAQTENIEEQQLFNEKVLHIQSKLKAPKLQYNSFGKYKYRSCDDIQGAVKPLLEETGLTLVLSDYLDMVGARFYVKATAKLSDGIHYIESTAFAREEDTKKGMDSSQITGAASSYARKYALNGLFLIDDTKDSDATNTHDKKETRKTEKPKEYNSDYVLPAGDLQGKKIREVHDVAILVKYLEVYGGQMPDGLKSVIQGHINDLSALSQNQIGNL